MKLKNKATGEIGYLYEHSLTQDMIIVYDVRGIVDKYTSIAKLNEEWEDALEEPKEKHWYITSWGEVWQYGDDPLHEEWRILLGNDFETKEEAEKAVEKLRAWKRLKDKGFRFHDFVRDAIYYEISDEEIEKYVVRKDLDLLFGGEE